MSLVTAINKEWEEKSVGEVADINAMSIGRNYSHETIQYIDVAAVDNRRVAGVEKIYQKDAPSRAKRIVRDNDILISTVRPNLKHFCFIKEAEANMIASTGFAVISAKKEKADPYFLYYLLTTETYTKTLSRIADGHTSAYPSFNPSVIEKSVFLFPIIDQQRAIGNVLSSLDNKIELLRKQNETLEQIAQTIFNEWFVEFNFPNDKGEPYKASGGKMVESELGEIPEGWSVKSLSDIAEIDWGNTNLTKKAYIENGEFLGVSAVGCDGRMSHFEYIKYTPVISAIGEYCGRIFLPYEDFTAIKNTMVVKQKDTQTSFFSYLGLQIWKLNRRGAAQPFLSKGDTEKIKIALPNNQFLGGFEIIMVTYFKKIRGNYLQIRSLSETRDILLPKLMSGELRVKI